MQWTHKQCASSAPCKSYYFLKWLSYEISSHYRYSKSAQRDRAAHLRHGQPDHVLLVCFSCHTGTRQSQKRPRLLLFACLKRIIQLKCLVKVLKSVKWMWSDLKSHEAQGMMAERLLDRLEDCKREFPVAVVLGGAGEDVIKRLTGNRAGIKEIYHFDQSRAMLERTTGLQKVKGGPPLSLSSLYMSSSWAASSVCHVESIFKLYCSLHRRLPMAFSKSLVKAGWGRERRPSSNTAQGLNLLRLPWMPLDCAYSNSSGALCFPDHGNKSFLEFVPRNKCCIHKPFLKQQNSMLQVYNVAIDEEFIPLREGSIDGGFQ